MISENDHESSAESDLLDCISVSKDNGVTGFTPSDRLNMFRFWCLGFQRNIGCVKELQFTGGENKDGEVSLTLWDRCTFLRFLRRVVWPVSTFSC